MFLIKKVDYICSFEKRQLNLFLSYYYCISRRRRVRGVDEAETHTRDKSGEEKHSVVAKISHRAGADMDSKPGSLNPAESQLLSTEPQQLARDI